MKKNVKILLLLNNLKQRDIARECGVTDAMISHVIAGNRESKRIKKHIAKMLHISEDELWAA